MPRQLWGEFQDEDNKANVNDNMIPVVAKRAKLEEMQSREPKPIDKNVKVRIKNPLVTQTIEVMKQTEMLQSLIDTYSNKSGSSNYLLNPCQMIPEVDFPPENAVDFVTDDKFIKPIWFIPPSNSPFARGVPQTYPAINGEVCRASLRKAICGQLRVSGFTDTAESALVLFADAIEEFIRSLMQHLREVHSNDPIRETQQEVQIKSLEKAYFSLTNTSLLQVHNYFKHSVIARNRCEIAEFNGVLQEYDKLMKESQSMQKEDFHEGHFLNILEIQPSQSSEMPSGQESGCDMHVGVGAGIDGPSTSAAMLSMMEGQAHMSVVQQSGTFKDVFHSKPLNSVSNLQQATESMNPYTAESLLQPQE